MDSSENRSAPCRGGFFLTCIMPFAEINDAEQVSSADWATAGEGYSAFSFLNGKTPKPTSSLNPRCQPPLALFPPHEYLFIFVPQTISIGQQVRGGWRDIFHGLIGNVIWFFCSPRITFDPSPVNRKYQSDGRPS